MAGNEIRRVLMTTDTMGGVWTFALDLAREFCGEGIEVVLASLGNQPSPDQRAEAESLANVCLLPGDFKLEWMHDPWSDIAASGQWLLRLEDEFRPDVVHLNSFGHGALPWSAPAILTAHSCVFSWWMAVRGERAPGHWNKYKELVACSLAAVDQVISPTAAMARALHDNYALDLSTCAVIPNGRRAGLFQRGPKERLIFTAGRLWDEAKNIAAVGRIASRLPWPVYAAGQADHPDGGTAHFDGCRLLGPLTPREMSGWLSRASIYVLPAQYEPFGLSALEAALSGCALVLGDIPSLREVWGDAAVFVNPNDTEGLRESVNSLIADRELLADMSGRSFSRACTYTSERMAHNYLNVYSSARRTLECVS